ncbi:hypothetical protein LMG7974_00650 [Campylobacter majalis]|uniref:Aminotransferase n=1 Tax=Campylobacter majalis TaxID=2790656 RepID=A0ABM8Q4N0_9BACT|nr:ferritin-like domain-containing protein [Campylobacter majalis]CAD7287769.1 hypothetical protein LMG7974_00650 [Campylobacter majalis]
MHNQIYNIEKSAISMYDRLGNMHEIFVNIKHIREQGLALIEEYAKQKEYDLIVKHSEVLEPKNLKDAFVYALAYENTLCQKYEILSNKIEDDVLRDICFRLWATSNNEYIVALNECVKQTFSDQGQNNTQNFDYTNVLSGYQNDFNNMSESLQNIMSGKLDKAELSRLLSSPNFSFFSGLALGALGASMLAKLDKSDENDE